MFEEDHAPVTLNEISEQAVSYQCIDPAHQRQSLSERLLPPVHYANTGGRPLLGSSFSFGGYVHRTIVGLCWAAAARTLNALFILERDVVEDMK